MDAAAPRLTLFAVVAALVVAAGSTKTNRIPSFAGPFIAYADKFYQCLIKGRQGDVHMVFRQITRFNPTKPFDKTLLSGFVNSSRALDDSWWASVEIAIRSNNQWKDHAFILKFPNVGCTGLRANVPNLFRVMFKRLGDAVLDKTPCTIPAGDYSFEREPVEWTFPNFPIFPYGHYRLTLLGGPKGYNDGTGCVIAEAHVIPKPH